MLSAPVARRTPTAAISIKASLLARKSAQIPYSVGFGQQYPPPIQPGQDPGGRKRQAGRVGETLDLAELYRAEREGIFSRRR